MTTHDQHARLDNSREDIRPETADMQPPTEHTEPAHADPSTVSAESTVPQSEWSPPAEAPDQSPSSMAPSDPSTAQSEPARVNTESSTDETLFADDELAGLRARWDSVQAEFVDDPRACVQKADGLVSDLVEQLTAGFASARSRLEEQWARGEEASTEDLRVALQRYREFFQRLLAV